jgi:hypothetical protein
MGVLLLDAHESFLGAGVSNSSLRRPAPNH